jgi:uncharacterized protein with NAD-binding domain and iron-sulfur cluster
MVAAWELTATPELRARFDVTVYQRGWRIGGKGASGRNLTPNYGHRIEEHGLHIWMGFYYNAFQVMQQAYAEWQQPATAPLKSWTDAFKPHDLITLEEQIDGAWLHWPVEFPRNDGIPGQGGANLDAWQLTQLALGWLEDLFKDHLLSATGTQAPAGAAPVTRPRWIEGLLDKVESKVARAVEETALRVAIRLAKSLHPDAGQHSAADHSRLAGLLREFKAWLWHRIEDEIDQHTPTRRLWLMLDLGLSTMIGLFEEGVLTRKQGLDELDRYEWREFLRKYGLTEANAWAAPIRAVYDLAFGYRDGVADPDHADMAAGTTIRGLLRMMFGYKGSIFYKMQAGMGDTVFSPLYSVLVARGVRFEFFQQVQSLQPAATEKVIEQIVVQRQATVKPGQMAQGGYQPLLDVLGVPSWPAEPLYDQLVEGEALRASGVDLESSWADWPGVGAPVTLQRGVDFDQVVLGISLGALRQICAPLVAADSRWQQMVDQVKTVRTQAFQLWLTQDAAAMGWIAPQRAVVGSYVEPMDTWADMSQLLPREDWPAAHEPKNVSYFCGPKDESPPTPPLGPNPEFPRAALAEVKAQALAFLANDIAHLWPKATSTSGGLDWNLLVDPQGGEGLARLESQYFRVNIDPSERYVLSIKNSLGARIKSGESGYTNLVLAGDWTRNGLSVGCVESATLGGLEAARAVIGSDELFPGEVDSLAD